MKPSIAALLFLACAGCASVGPALAPAATPEARARIVVDQTTAAEVRQILGEPSRILWLRAEQREGWAYSYTGSYEPREFWVELSADGKVRATSDAPDFTARRYRSSGP